jgi:hypothetical protein
MAFSLKITGIPRDSGMPVWTVDMPNWWNTAELKAELPFRTISEDGYIDEVVIISVHEARKLQNRFRSHADQFEASKVEKLDGFLAKSPPETRFILLNIYEWESGLG